MKRRLGKDATVDDYLATVPVEHRDALERLRGIIRAAAPEATELISYQIPVFKLHSHLVGFASFKRHCSFFVMGRSVLEDFKDELNRFGGTSAGTIHFTPENPLPATLIKRIVKARVKQNNTNWEKQLRKRTRQKARNTEKSGTIRSQDIGE